MRFRSLHAVCLGVLLVTSSAAADRKHPLEGKPSVMNRYELRQGRFNLGPSFGFAFDRTLRQAATFGLKAEYHFHDMFSVGVDAGFGVGFNTGLANRIEDRYNAGYKPIVNGAPQDWSQLQQKFSDLQMQGDLRFVFTPLSGKMGIFSGLFVGYDFYGFAGLGLALLKNNYASGDPNFDDKVTEGVRLGPAFGVGMQLYFTHWMAMGFEVKNLMFLDNESGGDRTRGTGAGESSTKILVNSDDSEFMSHWMLGLNFTFYLPTVPTISK